MCETKREIQGYKGLNVEEMNIEIDVRKEDGGKIQAWKTARDRDRLGRCAVNHPSYFGEKELFQGWGQIA